MKKLIISNVVYGPTYSEIFAEYHLKSLLDDSNIAALKKNGFEYIIYTDVETRRYLEKHPNMYELLRHCEVELRDFTWKPGVNRFGLRYTLLVHQLRDAIELGIKKECLVSPIVADLVFSVGFWKRTLARIEEGHDAVLVLPPRGVIETIAPKLKEIIGAPTSLELFDLVYANMHPLWTSCHWDAPQFTDQPFTLLWNSGHGLLARSYSVTPIVFEPNQDMRITKKVIDIEIPGLCKNPYWATDWIDAPVAGVEPITCHFPTFRNNRRAGRWIAEWAGQLHATQHETLERKLYYPSRAMAQIDYDMERASDLMVTLLSKAHKSISGGDANGASETKDGLG